MIEKNRLSRRQREILSWASRGKTNWEIAIILKCKEATIVYHIKEAGRKLGAVNKTHAVSKAIHMGLLRDAQHPEDRIPQSPFEIAQ
jgi:LuxR family transcriptional regulator, quorum-sensing system regulator BjaR1